jgi:hypothetical protein
MRSTFFCKKRLLADVGGRQISASLRLFWMETKIIHEYFVRALHLKHVKDSKYSAFLSLFFFRWNCTDFCLGSSLKLRYISALYARTSSLHLFAHFINGPKWVLIKLVLQ